MKFVDTIKTDITWLTVRGTEAEIQRLIDWTNKHRTAYVIAGKRVAWYDEDDPMPHLTRFMRSQMGIVIYEQRFGFKAASDALRCKLTLA